MKKILLLGGTGAIGKSLAILFTKYHDVDLYITSRKKRDSSSSVHYLIGDAHNVDFLNHIFATIKDIDCVIDFMVWDTDLFMKTYTILLDNSRRYIYISSARVYANSEKIISEESEKLFDIKKERYFICKDTYAVPKSQQENILMNSNYDNFTIIRPYITYGENRIPLGDLEKEIWIYRILKGRTLVISEDVIYRYTSLTNCVDCARSIENLIDSPDAKRSIVTISTSECMKWDNVLSIYKTVFERNHIRVNCKIIPKSIKSLNYDYQTIYDRVFDRRFNTEKLNKYIKVDSFVCMSDGLTKALDAFLYNPQFNNELIDWKLQAQMDKICHERADKSEFTSFSEYFKYLIYRFTPFLRIKRFIKKTYIWIYNKQ